MRSFWVRAVVGVVLVFAAVLLLWVLNGVSGGTPVVSGLLLPVAITAYAFRRGPGLIASAASVGGALYLMRELWRFDELADVERMLVLAIIGVTMSLLSGWLHDARRGAAAATTARAESQERLDASERHFAVAFEACPLPYAMMRLSDRTFIAVNEAFATFFGYRRDELIGHCSDEIAFYADPVEGELVRVQMAHEGRLHQVPLTLRRKDGATRRVLTSNETVTLDGISYGVGVFTDITEKDEAERELRATQEMFSSVFSQSPLPAAISRVRDRVVVAANDQWLRLFGYTREAILGMPADRLALYADPEDGERIREQLARDEEVRDVELRFVRDDGREFDALWSVDTIDIGGEPHYLGTLQDITDRKRAEEAVRESEARFRQLAENIREVFWLYDAKENKVVYVSPAYETVWERSRAAIGADPDDWMLSIHAEDRARVADTRHRQDYNQQYRIVRSDGTERIIHDRAFPVRDASGRVVRMAGIAEDITDRIALEHQLRQTQKMESLGLLAGGVAHDFNNLLAVIASSNGMLAETLRQGEERELVEEIDAAVQRATGLTRQLLAFSRKQVVEPKVLDINAAVQETRKMLRRMVGEDVLLQTSLEPELGHVKVDPGYLVQVLMNLAVNARDAMPRGGTLEIATRRVFVDDLQVRRHPGATTGPAVEVSVADTGCGIAPDALAHIFEPFFTTKEQGKGTGMGLAVVHGIVEQAGGFIEVDSNVGQGTMFRVYLPIVNVEIDRPSQVAVALALGGEKILFVDDDEYVRRAAARALRARGYTVIEAADGRAALLQLHESIDLLLTDVVMPRMDGRELADLACRAKPGLKVLYTSGYTDDAIVRHGVAAGNFELIEKPFRVDTLATRIRRMLDR
jgi:two-component system, cell cycle sensor histidine kinase and response regulator CckA